MSDYALPLKYGCNAHQIPARIYREEGALPIDILNGEPGYINFLVMSLLAMWI